ncbi:MAG: DNA gyrase subunit A [Acidobacteriota bacterium]
MPDEPGQGQEIPVNLEDEMKSSYLDYAMSVIIGRALPDVRDGLKPVHRRILYAMHELSNTFGRPYKKSARIVGEVIGKYHPHGDTAVYDTIVRMAQQFSMRDLLIDGQGNFGSVDGDSPAAMRYTEIRMSRLAEELLSDLDKDTVDFQANYDETLQEPLVLPSRVPNLLVNGGSGIAVGMATNIPPHNLGEIIDAALLLLERPYATLDELLEIVPGPDFPTGACLFGRQAIRQAYRTGRGIIQLRAVADFEEIRQERQAIIISELPYLVNKAKLVEKIAHLVHAKKIEGISDLRDESDRQGMRIVIELKRGMPPQIVLNQLYKQTSLQTSFGVNMLAIVEGKPQVLSLSQALLLFLDHRREVVRRRTLFELDKAKKRGHILEGLAQALDHLDAIIALIRASESPDMARQQLMERLEFSAQQSQAILDMRLQRLTGLEREKILQELEEVRQRIADLQGVLSSETVLKGVIRKDLLEVQEKFSTPRRTLIAEYEAGLTIEDLIADEPVVITATHSGYLKRTALSVYRSQHRGGKGRIGMSTRTAEDIIDYLFIASTHSYILIVTDKGRVYWLKVYEIPEVAAAGKGRPLVNLVSLEPDEKIAGMLSVQDFQAPGSVVMASKQGYIKKTPLAAFSHPRAAGIIACSVAEGDSLHSVSRTTGQHDILLCTRRGKAIRFSENDVRKMGRTARGVRGIRIKGGDELVSLEVIDPAEEEEIDVLAVTAKGFGKRTPVSAYRRQGRGGQGVINIRTTRRNGPVVGVCEVRQDSEVVLITSRGKIIRLLAGQIRQTQSRGALGVKVIDVDAEDSLSAMTLVPSQEDPEQEAPEADGQGQAQQAAEGEDRQAESEEGSGEEASEAGSERESEE